LQTPKKINQITRWLVSNIIGMR